MSESARSIAILDEVVVRKIYVIRGEKVMLDRVWLYFLMLKPYV